MRCRPSLDPKSAWSIPLTDAQFTSLLTSFAQVTTAGSARDGQMKYFTLAGRHHSSLHCRLRVRAFVGAAAAALAGCIAFAAGQLGAALRDGPFRPERDQSPAGARPVIGPIVAGLTAGGMQ
jgi:hypothetical protein